MRVPRRLLQFLVLPSEPVLTVAKRVVDTSPLNLGVTAVARLDQLIHRSARRLLEIIDSALERPCAEVGQTPDPTRPAQPLQLPMLVTGNMGLSSNECG